MEKLSYCLLIYYYLHVVLLYITMLFTINSVVKRCLKKINSEITLKYSPASTFKYEISLKIPCRSRS